MGGGNGKEEVGLRPTTRWGRKAPDPFSLACHMSDTTEPEQLRIPFIGPEPRQLRNRRI